LVLSLTLLNKLYVLLPYHHWNSRMKLQGPFNQYMSTTNVSWDLPVAWVDGYLAWSFSDKMVTSLEFGKTYL
jgi:hypothetical protein